MGTSIRDKLDAFSGTAKQEKPKFCKPVEQPRVSVQKRRTRYKRTASTEKPPPRQDAPTAGRRKTTGGRRKSRQETEQELDQFWKKVQTSSTENGAVSLNARMSKYQKATAKPQPKREKNPEDSANSSKDGCDSSTSSEADSGPILLSTPNNPTQHKESEGISHKRGRTGIAEPLAQRLNRYNEHLEPPKTKPRKKSKHTRGRSGIEQPVGLLLLQFDNQQKPHSPRRRSQRKKFVFDDLDNLADGQESPPMHSTHLSVYAINRESSVADRIKAYSSAPKTSLSRTSRKVSAELQAPVRDRVGSFLDAQKKNSCSTPSCRKVSFEPAPLRDRVESYYEAQKKNSLSTPSWRKVSADLKAPVRDRVESYTQTQEDSKHKWRKHTFEIEPPPAPLGTEARPLEDFNPEAADVTEGMKASLFNDKERIATIKQGIHTDVSSAVANVTEEQKTNAAEHFENWISTKLAGGLSMEKIVENMGPNAPQSLLRAVAEARVAVLEDQLEDFTDNIEEFLKLNGYYDPKQQSLRLNHFPLFKLIEDENRFSFIWGLFMDFLESKPELSIIELSNIGLTDDMLREVVLCLQRCTNLKVFNIETNEVSSEALMEMAAALKNNKRLCELRLENQLRPLSEADSGKIVKELSVNRSLLRVTLDFYAVHHRERMEKCANRNFEVLRQKRLEERKKPTDLCKIYKQANKSQTDNVFDLSRTKALLPINPHDKTATNIALAILKMNPEKVLLDRAHVTNRFVMTLANGLCANPQQYNLTTLRLGGNAIYGPGMKSLARIIGANLPQLTAVQAQNQNQTLSSDEAKEILKALQQNEHLTKLGMDFRNNDRLAADKYLTRNLKRRWNCAYMSPEAESSKKILEQQTLL